MWEAVSLKVKEYKTRNCWRLIVPVRWSGTGKKQYKLFPTKEAGELERTRILNRGSSSKPQVSKYDEAALTLAQDLGLSPQQMLDAVRFYKTQIDKVTKFATLEECCAAFIEHQRHEKRGVRTISSDLQAYRKLCKSVGSATPMTAVTLEKLNDCIGALPPGGTRKTLYVRVKKFIKWAFDKHYTATDLMAGCKSADQWTANTEKMDVELFRRILFVTAGLEPINPGEEPTLKYQELLPRYVLGGLAGMRNCEIIRAYSGDLVIEWQDIFWKKNLIYVRHEVAKETKAIDRKRYPVLEPAAKEWLQLVAKPSGPIVALSTDAFGDLDREMRKALGVKMPKNGCRNSYASYGQSIWSPGQVARSMGDLESTVKRWYVETLEPGDGHAWFGVRPTMGRKIIAMTTAA